jgi:hypothetical protein
LRTVKREGIESGGSERKRKKGREMDKEFRMKKLYRKKDEKVVQKEG